MNEILIITVFNLILYFRTLKHNLIVDDIQWFMLQKTNKWEFKNLKEFIFFLQCKLYGVGTFSKNIQVEHAIRIILHTIASVLIYVAFGKNNISFMAALLYSCNPINHQTSLWLNGRRYVLNIIIVLLMLISPLFLPLYLLTLILQVTAIFSPILLIPKYPIILAALPLALVLVRKDVQEKIKERIKAIPDDDRKKFTPKRLIITVKHYGHFFFKMILPGKCASIYPKMYYWGITNEGNKEAYSFNKYFYQGILALIISIAIPILIPSIAIYSIFMSLAILQWCAIIPVTQDMADRYANLPNVFMMFILSYMLNTYIPQYATYIIIGLIVYYSCYLYQTMRMYINMIAFWDYQRYHFPEIPSPRKFEINWLIKNGDFIKAWILTREGLEYTPNDFTLLSQAAICHRAIGEIHIAKAFVDKARNNYYINQKEYQEENLNQFVKSIEPYLKKTDSKKGKK